MDQHYVTTLRSEPISRLTLLALLGFRPMHGYEIRSEIEERRMDRWADVSYGSIYGGLRQLAKEGLVEEAGTERSGRRPARTVYRITESGGEELRALLRQAWVRPFFPATGVDVALSFFPLLSLDEVSRLLGERLAALDGIAEGLDSAEKATTDQQRAQGVVRGIRAMVSDLFEHRRCLLAAERAWTERIMRRIREGDYAIDDEVLRRWRGACDGGADQQVRQDA